MYIYKVGETLFSLIVWSAVCGFSGTPSNLENGDGFMFVLSCLLVSGTFVVGDTVDDGLAKKTEIQVNNSCKLFINLPGKFFAGCVGVVTGEISSLPAIDANF